MLDYLKDLLENQYSALQKWIYLGLNPSSNIIFVAYSNRMASKEPRILYAFVFPRGLLIYTFVLVPGIKP